jgi:putative selenium metabolism protein SsnA
MALALTGGTIVASLRPVRVARGDLFVDGGRVVERADGATTRDCSGCLIVPGNVCAHTHLYSALARGMPLPAGVDPPSNFVQILQRVWWRLDRALDEESIRASALVGALDALLSGTTTVVDHHASPNAVDGSLDVIAGALAEVGLRSVLCYEVSDRDGPERAAAGIAENERFLRGVPGRALARGMVGAHASFTLSKETLAACVDLAGRASTGIHIHVAEDGADQRDCEARFGVPVVERLAEAGALSERSLLAHCVHLHPSELGALVASGTVVAHNPRSNMNNAVGRAPAEAMGERVALGTDGIGGDLFAEARAAFWRAREDDLSVAPSWAVERLAAGAEVAGRAFEEPALGTLVPGAPADLVVLDYAAPTPMDESTLAGHWLFGLGARHVRDVVVGGELVVADRRPTRVDPDAVAVGAARAARSLWARLERVDVHPFEPAGSAA